MNDETGQLDTTVEEWKEALEVKNDEGQTIGEIAVATGVPESTVRRKLKKLIKEGKCIKGKASRSYPNIAGGCEYAGWWNVYQLIGEEKCSES